MNKWETSICENGNELRGRIGLQFFAEDEGGSDTGADTDGDYGTDFEDGLFDGDLEDQQGAGQDTGEDGDGGLENQQPDGQPQEPEQDKGDGAAPPPSDQQQEQPPPQQQQPPQLVQMTYNGQQYMLPQAAIDEIGRALGVNAVELLQKGMNYDHKAERELSILNRYAAAANMSLPQFVQSLETLRQQQELAAEVEKCKNEFPNSEDGAVQEIAKSRIAARRNAELQQANARAAQAQQVRSRVDQTVQQMQKQREAAQWDEYAKQTGIQKAEDIPLRVLALVNQGCTPLEAHWRYQNEQAQAELKRQNDIKQQQERNRQTSTGSLAGAGVEEDAFLAGLFG